uniref:Uncharacterized protein n=1 Tax=uncultured bacterium CBNPD1 BAC clone 1664 TaxID=417310 RepID=B1N6N9_9BACT|nr:hypothetical protein [uncultured bacterium CBNPD1 BAC clone 1664]
MVVVGAIRLDMAIVLVDPELEEGLAQRQEAELTGWSDQGAVADGLGVGRA